MQEVLDPFLAHQRPPARFRYVRRHDHWRRYWMRYDLRSHAYEPHPTTTTLSEAVKIVDEYAYSGFFG